MIEEIKVDIRKSKVLEAVGLIHVLTECDHHEFLSDEIQYFSYLQTKHAFILDILKGFYVRGLELFEFMLKIKNYDDISYYIKECENFDNLEYITLLLDFKDNKEIITSLKTGQKKLKDIFKFRGIMENENYLHSLDYLFCNTKDFRDKINNLLFDIDNDENFHRIIDSLDSKYQNEIITIKEELKNRHPLSFSQSYMGKHFYNIADFRYYAFIPTYFISPHTIRYMDTNGQILLIRLVRKKYEANEIKEDLENFLKILSDPNRLEIARLLRKRPMYGKEIAEHLNIKTPTISHHIEQLRKIGLINIERDKNIKYFSLNTNNFNRLTREIRKYIFEF